MDVYYNKNMWEKGKPETKLAVCPVNQSFLWEEQEIFIPAIYTGKAGAVLDVCAKISTADMTTFLKKWNYERRMSLKTPEEFEQIDADNPGSREFAVDVCLDGTSLIRRMNSSVRWYPKNIIQMGNTNPTSIDEFENDKSAEEWMEAYNCDRTCCWYFNRLSYDWRDEPILSPQNILLAFQANLISTTVGHFSTDASCNGKTITAVHPLTGQEYTLTLHECEQTRHSFTGIETKDMIYPEYSQILSYSITPEIDRNLFDIRDCVEGDKPRIRNTQREDGPTAIFMAGKSAASDKRTACSSLHFEPVPEVQWRMVFQIKPKDNMAINFPIS
ncbi:MAG: hypothetical protein NC417_01910 [Candidatus Gastranaerophilales bacterium]|nr:hypothetical protein [Candidatus Gastranaerophilales bacterium]